MLQLYIVVPDAVPYTSPAVQEASGTTDYNGVFLILLTAIIIIN